MPGGQDPIETGESRILLIRVVNRASKQIERMNIKDRKKLINALNSDQEGQSGKPNPRLDLPQVGLGIQVNEGNVEISSFFKTDLVIMNMQLKVSILTRIANTLKFNLTLSTASCPSKRKTFPKPELVFLHAIIILKSEERLEMLGDQSSPEDISKA
ncbi:hypothetical protein H4Q26_012586 [Puccinia striiformis f. sp. tritici PST-130]|nr:hypothetical protein H4Q26_012586 [Puccinia striiformis f. sp. tritici PST-130]